MGPKAFFLMYFRYRTSVAQQIYQERVISSLVLKLFYQKWKESNNGDANLLSRNCKINIEKFLIFITIQILEKKVHFIYDED